MRDLVWFDKKIDYEDYIKNELMAEAKSWGCQFYNNLIQFTIDHRAPIFYTISDPSEHFAFSGAYHFETKRERYPNKTRENLFWLHDFTHMLFKYPFDLYDWTEREFIKNFWKQERLASTETEILAYYRVPGLREKVFPDERLWYDCLIEHGWENKPDPLTFLYRREGIQEGKLLPEELEDDPEILDWILSWNKLTPKWCSKRFRSMAGIRMPEHSYIYRLLPNQYESTIELYHMIEKDADEQAGYERLMMDNVKRAYAILGMKNPPQRWRHMPEAIDQLEGAVFFK